MRLRVSRPGAAHIARFVHIEMPAIVDSSPLTTWPLLSSNHEVPFLPTQLSTSPKLHLLWTLTCAIVVAYRFYSVLPPLLVSSIVQRLLSNVMTYSYSIIRLFVLNKLRSQFACPFARPFYERAATDGYRYANRVSQSVIYTYM